MASRVEGYPHVAMKALTSVFFRQIHSATRRYIVSVTGSRKGTSNMHPRNMLNAYERNFAVQIKGNISAATGHLVKALKEKVGKQGPPRSLPYNPPKRDTGIGQASIRRRLIRGPAAEFGQMIWLHPIGWYMAALEVGIESSDGQSRILERPWLSTTIKEQSRTLDRILRKGF